MAVTESSKCAVLGHHEAVQSVSKRARETLHDQREMARRALLHQRREFLAATHQYEPAARQHLVSTLARTNEVHNCNVQMQARQLEQEADARFHQIHWELSSRFLRKQIKLLMISEKNW